jgi:hypothetical protein
MKYSALRNQVATPRALFPIGLTVRITGGLPPGAADTPLPPGGDLKAQAALFRCAPAEAPDTSVTDAAEPPPGGAAERFATSHRR